MWIAKADGPEPKQLSKDKQSEFAEAKKLLEQGLLENARAAAEKGLDRDPRSVEGLNLLGIIDSERKDYGGAIAAFEAALKIDDRSAATHDNLGKVYVAQNKLDLAEREFRAALRLDPRDRDANYNLGLVLMARGQSAQAVPFFRSVRPLDPSASLNLIRAYLRSGQVTKALEQAHAISEKSKDDVRLHFSLGVLLASEKQYVPAMHELETADALQPRTFEILHDLGEAYLHAGRTEKATSSLVAALGLKPDSVETMILLGEAYTAQRKDLDALEVLTRARQTAPRNTDVIYLLARLSMMQSFHEDAIALLEEGVKIDPQRSDLHEALGESTFTVGKADRAIREFETLVRLEPSASSYGLLGLCYRHLGRFEEATKYLRDGLKIDPRNAARLYNLGAILNKQGNIEQAEKFLQEALRQKPDFEDALEELASVRMAQKRFAEAVPLLRHSIRVSASPAEAYYKLSTAERALHETEAAERDLKIFQTLSKDPTSGSNPYQHLFEYLNERVALPTKARTESDLEDLLHEVERHPDRPKGLYLLAEAYLKLGRVEEARKTVARLDGVSGGDARTALGAGVLLARYRLYPDALEHFQSAASADPSSDDARFDVAETYFRLGDFLHAFESLQQLSPQTADDEAVMALRGDLYARLGRFQEAAATFESALARDPENDQYCLSLALARLRAGELEAARGTLKRGLARTPNSAKLNWGMGVLSVAEGSGTAGEQHLKKAVDLEPEWQAGLSSLGVYYYQTGQTAKAREILRQSVELNPQSGLDVTRIEKALDAPPAGEASHPAIELSPEARRQFLQIVLALVDRRP